MVKGRNKRWTNAGICVAMMRTAMRAIRRIGEKDTLNVGVLSVVMYRIDDEVEKVYRGEVNV